MDTQPHFFSDCVDLDEEANEYVESPEHNLQDDTNDAQHFHLFATRVNANGSPMPITKTEDMGVEGWENLPHMEMDRDQDPKPLFVDPDLYDEGNEEGQAMDDEEPQRDIDVAFDSQPTTRRTSSAKSFLSERTTKSGSASTDITPPDQDPPKKRKVRKTKKDVATAEDEQKRNKFLERNRIAASKCREKKKQYVSNLEETKIGLENQHAHLQMEYNGLLEEVGSLKHHLMVHAKCNDPNIDSWLTNEARRFVSQDLFGAPFPGFGPVVPQSGQPSHGRNPSTASTYSGFPTDGLSGPDRRSSIAYSQGQYHDTSLSGDEFGNLHSQASSLQTSPTEAVFPVLASPRLKREPGMNYDHMPDALFASDQPVFGTG